MVEERDSPDKLHIFCTMHEVKNCRKHLSMLAPVLCGVMRHQVMLKSQLSLRFKPGVVMRIEKGDFAGSRVGVSCRLSSSSLTVVLGMNNTTECPIGKSHCC